MVQKKHKKVKLSFFFPLSGCSDISRGLTGQAVFIKFPQDDIRNEQRHDGKKHGVESTKENFMVECGVKRVWQQIRRLKDNISSDF